MTIVQADKMDTIILCYVSEPRSIIFVDFVHDLGLFDWWILSRARNNRWKRKTLQHDYCMVSKWGNAWEIS